MTAAPDRRAVLASILTAGACLSPTFWGGPNDQQGVPPSRRDRYAENVWARRPIAPGEFSWLTASP